MKKFKFLFQCCLALSAIGCIGNVNYQDTVHAGHVHTSRVKDIHQDSSKIKSLKKTINNHQAEIKNLEHHEKHSTDSNRVIQLSKLLRNTKQDINKLDKIKNQQVDAKARHHLDHYLHHSNDKMRKLNHKSSILNRHEYGTHIQRELKKLSSKKTSGYKVSKLKKSIKKHIRHKEAPYSKLMDFSQFVEAREPEHYEDINSNTRDLGGYPALHNKYVVKKHKLIRSNDLTDVSSDGIHDLEHQHVHTIIDLRNPYGSSSISKHPDKGEKASSADSSYLSGTNIKIYNAPVYSQNEKKHMHKELKAYGEYYFYGKPAVDNSNAIHAYRKVFRIVLHNHHGGILIHCTAGHDRTGTTSALLLSALGVNRKYIVDDYMLSNVYDNGRHHTSNEKQHRQIEHFFNTIDTEYGSVNNYLSQRLGMNSHKIHELRKIYLIKI